MAVAAISLNNMTVPAGDAAGNNQGLLMPKLQYRFRLLFLNFGGETEGFELTKQVIDCSRPNVSFAKISLPVYNSTVYMAGKHTWQTMSINIRDDAAGNVSRLVGYQLQKQLDFYEQASAASGQDYKFELNLQILDGGNGSIVPTVLETWELYGCYLEGVNYNTVNYGTSEDVRIALTVQFDNAVQADLGAGVGTTNLQVNRNATGLTTGLGGGAPA